MKTDTAPASPDCLYLTKKDEVQVRRRVLIERDRLLRRIEAALDRMDAGRYGLCTQCNGKIPLRQLEQDPARKECPECVEANTLA
ncbi:TraR/DksA family transcriptional regulator [Hyphomonas johnsonii]|uniref:DksA-type zinc finger protein n=1 Tax=Hyphomonas johnsonii MHS-2 TaxID=1280950 RepID=A0A059FP99_9PROT|nr:hypothetical protein [Hyphomonas johnsonii]KCZ92442.1 dksA-type zinc finger protein [Hyphomonas johnsonii MHS-2]